MSHEADYYGQQELWGQVPEPYQEELLRDLLSLLPPSIRSILDVGCGDGFNTNALPAELEVVGMDISAEALKHVRRETRLGSVTDVPFPDRSFDLVMANAVIEHIADPDYAKALSELHRVARRYILIVAPFMEDLRSGLTCCAACGSTYHVNRHYRAFGITELGDLFGPGAMRVVVLSGSSSPQERLYRALRAELGYYNQWEHAVCPSCGARASTSLATDDDQRLLATLLEALPASAGMPYPDRNVALALYDLDSSASQAEADAEGPELLLDRDAHPRPAPARLRYDGHDAILHAEDEAGADEARRAWVQIAVRGVRYRYSAPHRTGPGRFAVPRWFHPLLLPDLSGRLGALATVPPGTLLSLSHHALVRSVLGREVDAYRTKMETTSPLLPRLRTLLTRLLGRKDA